MKEFLIRFGLTDKEAKAFLELVKLGASPVTKWAKQAQINRSSMYVILEKLLKDGLVTTFISNGVQHAQAIPTVELKALINDKEDFLLETKSQFERLLPDFQKLEKNNGIIPKVKFYEGKKRVEMMYEEVLKENSFCAFFNPQRVKIYMPEYFDKIPLTLRQNGGAAKELLIPCKEASEYIEKYLSPKHQIKLLGSKVDFSSDTIITNQKIYLVGYSKDDVVGTEIWNEELAKTQTTLFDLIWATSKK